MLHDTLKRHWGFDTFLPGQREAVETVMSGRDSLVIFPTGGGKSLTYQLPALCKPGVAIVVSPLIALMIDQVEALRANGVAAATMNSTTELATYVETRRSLREGRLDLLYVSPERLLADDMGEVLAEVEVAFFAIDEAHCISHWGHDFRPGYRALTGLRGRFPEVPIHACTATATEAVRADIVETLGLRDPAVLVGSFDRPNLAYRVRRRTRLLDQVTEVLARHEGEGGIIYCIRKSEVDDLCTRLQALGHNAVPYHAGMSADERQRSQEAFSRERADVVVATVAFGMGIDRSNVRYVLHAGMPKSVEHYLQEAGRAGRDGEPAECVLLYSGQDPMVWRSILGEPQAEADHVAHRKVEEMYDLCRTLSCRHRYFVTYFGESYEREGCGACDVCLGENAVLADSTTVARKILACVARIQQRRGSRATADDGRGCGYGARHVAEVLKGVRGGRVAQVGHDGLSTHGLLAEYGVDDIADWIDQLVGAGLLMRLGEWRTLGLTGCGASVMRGEGTVSLSRILKPHRAQPTVDGVPGEALFQSLRALRRELAAQRGVPPYVIFSDATLRELARCRPLTPEAFRAVKGVGETKTRTLAHVFIEAIRAHEDGPSDDESRQGTETGFANQTPFRP